MNANLDHWEEPENLTVSQAAQAANVRESRIRTALFRRELTYLKIGALVRIPRKELQEWLNRCVVHANGNV